MIRYLLIFWLLVSAPSISFSMDKNETIPDRHGLCKEFTTHIFEEIRKESGFGEEWRLVFVGVESQKACLKEQGSKGGNIFISLEFIHKLNCGCELAYIFGHEFAHILLGHIYNPNSTDTDRVEAEADYLGMVVANKAGYGGIDICKFLEDKKFPTKRIEYLRQFIKNKGF